MTIPPRHNVPDLLSLIAQYKLRFVGGAFAVVGLLGLVASYLPAIEWFAEAIRLPALHFLSVGVVVLVLDTTAHGQQVKVIKELLAESALAPRLGLLQDEEVLRSLLRRTVDETLRAVALPVYKPFPEELFSNKCTEARAEIRILQTYIPGTLSPLLDGLVAAAKAGRRVRILLLNPVSPVAKQRMTDVGYEDIDRLSVAWRTLQHKLVTAAVIDRIEMSFYHVLPPFSLFAADDQLFLGLFWHGQESMGGPHVFLHAGASEFTKSVANCFDAIWETATPARDHPWWTGPL